MFFKIIMYYILGYASISVEGYFIERFINICISKNILLWNVKRKKSSFLFTNIAIKDFKKIRKIARITRCHVKIEKKKGLPFLLNRYKKRKIFIGLLIVITFIIIGLSNFVWNIEITGNNNISKEELLTELDQYGLKTGMLKAKVKTKDVINNIRLNRNDIAWIGIKMLGTNAVVEVVEADKKPEIIDENEYCNIVSDKEGMITKINVQNGTALVKVGDIVTKR
ncbi:MAG: sporulation protein YqfD [Clostridia bacterium]|nr:sporulation protein YqfD [Clostridia bacterium]